MDGLDHTNDSHTANGSSGEATLQAALDDGAYEQVNSWVHRKKGITNVPHGNAFDAAESLDGEG